MRKKIFIVKLEALHKKIDKSHKGKKKGYVKQRKEELHKNEKIKTPT